jgi:hypothetical protein
MGGLFERVLQKYADEEKYPFGPPSHITRRLIGEADSRVLSFFRNVLFYDLKTGFRLIVLGCALQLVGVWA